jgi:hypothetical protein
MPGGSELTAVSLNNDQASTSSGIDEAAGHVGQVPQAASLLVVTAPHMLGQQSGQADSNNDGQQHHQLGGHSQASARLQVQRYDSAGVSMYSLPGKLT